MFYDRFAYNLELQQLRYNVNGSLQNEYQVANPQFFLPPQAPDITSATASTNVYQNNPNLHAPYTIQTGVTLERQLTKTPTWPSPISIPAAVHQFLYRQPEPCRPNDGPTCEFSGGG